MRSNATRHPDKRESAKAAEMRLFTDLVSIKADRRPLFTVDWIVRNYNVSAGVARDRLGQAQQRWAAE